MGEEDTATEPAQAAAINGSSSPDKTGEPVADDNDKVNDTNAMDEDVKDDAKLDPEEMDEDPKIQDETDTKEVGEDTEEGAPAEADGRGVVEEEKVCRETPEEMQNKEAMKHEETKEDEEEEKREPQVEAMEQDSESAEKKEVGEKGTSDDTEREKIVMSTEGEEEEGTTKEVKEEDEDMREDKEGEDNVKDQKEEEDEVKVEKEEAEEMNKDKEEEEEIKEKKGSNNHRKGKGARGKGEDKAKSVKTKKELEPKTPVTPAIDRPVRERKSVERLVAIIEKDSSKDFHIEKGRGTALKDIPNVAYKLSRKKSDETFKLLHTILFGRRGKAFQIKNNISRFSGFVWHDNEDKQKMKVKEKLDKCNKEKLLEFCDVLDIPISKATTRKEDIITKLIEFMLAPHATTDVLLVEKDLSSKGKRKRVTKPSSSAGTPRSTKSRREVTDTSKSKHRKYTSGSEGESEEEEEDETNEETEKENGVHSQALDGSSEQSASEEKDSESEEDSDEDTKKHKNISNKESAKKESASRAKSDKTVAPKKSSQPPKSAPKKSVSNRTKINYDSDSSPKVSSKKKEKSATLKAPTPSKAATPKSATKEKAGKKVSKGKEKTKEEKMKLSDKVLRAEICKILKEVDFNTATFTDILKQLAKKFEMDLTSRKSSIKLIIQEELTKLADEPDEEEVDEGEAEGTQSGQEVRG